MRKSHLLAMLSLIGLADNYDSTLTSSRRSGHSWLTPVNKESFKQSRRKQLKLRSKNKAKSKGQA